MSPAETGQIISKIIRMLRNPGEQYLNTMINVASELGGNSTNEDTDAAHKKFLELFQNSSISEQKRIKKIAEETFDKVCQKLEKEFCDIENMTSDVKARFKFQIQK